MSSDTLISKAKKWIGPVPNGWRYIPLKYACEYNKEALSDCTDPTYTFDYVDISSVSLDDGIRSVERMSFKNAPSRARRVIKTGDVIMSTVRTYLKAIAVVPEHVFPMVASTGFLVARAKPDVISSSYLGYMLKSECFVSAIEMESVGVSYPAINSTDAVKNYIPLPPRDAQNAIVSYLDARCTPIDDAIARHRTVIGKLEEYRRAVIAHTVAGKVNGLNPSCWAWKRFKFIAHVDSNLVEPDGYKNWLHVSPDAIGKGDGRLLRRRTVSEDGVISSNHLFHKGAILYSKVRPRLNKVVIAPDDGLCSADMYPISTNQVTEWLRYYMLSDQFVEQAGLVSDIRIKMPKINQKELGNLKILVPSYEEQLDIVSHLDYQCAAVDDAINRQNQIIARLEEYRRSLIHAAVTGRIDCTKETL